MPVPTAHLGWNANPEPDILFYKLYVGTASGVYDAPGSPKNMGNVTDGTFTLPNYGTFFFALTAVNTGSLESGFSSEVQGAFPAPIAPGPGRFVTG